MTIVYQVFHGTVTLDMVLGFLATLDIKGDPVIINEIMRHYQLPELYFPTVEERKPIDLRRYQNDLHDGERPRDLEVY